MNSRKLDKLVKKFNRFAQVLELGTSQGDAQRNKSDDKRAELRRYKTLLTGTPRKSGWSEHKALNVVEAILNGQPVSDEDKQWAILDVKTHNPSIDADEFARIIYSD